MQIKFFSIPVFSSERSEDEMNKFLRSHRILQTERHFCPEQGGYWAVAVEYMDGDPKAEVPPVLRKDKKDYSKELNEEELKRFEYFKKVRAETARNNGIPAYLVFTNEELSILARIPELCEETTRNVKGVAPSRLRDFAKYFYVVKDGEESGQPDGENSRQGKSA